MKTAIVIGSGASGATIASKLQGEYQVTILERGKEFKPFSYPINLFSKLRKTQLLFDERLIRLLLPNMIVDKTKDMVLVRGFGIGGTTTLATGNAVRYDKNLKEIGINLDKEFEELYKELPITTAHQDNWTDLTKKMYEIFKDMGLDPVVTPKFLDEKKCVGCGHCAIGCPTNAKWDTRKLIDEAVKKGAKLITGFKVEKLIIEDNKVRQVVGKKGLNRVNLSADLIVLAAGGLSTPLILKNSGINVESKLFVDPVLCVAGPLKDAHQERQILMPFIAQKDGYIISPYMDYLSFFFNKKWYTPMKDIVSIMIKLADEEKGDVERNKVEKVMSEKDDKKMAEAIALCQDILEKLGVKKETQFLGTLNAGHPGGMLPLSEKEKDSLHHDFLPKNLYVSDASLFPKSMGNPPILTIMALSRKIAKTILESQQSLSN